MKQKLFFSIFICCITTIVLSLLFLLGFFTSWQNRLTDSLFIPKHVQTNIALITIDDKSIAQIGRYPWNRSVYAELLQTLGDNPLAIGLDISFSEKSNEDTQLADQFNKIPIVVLPVEVTGVTANNNTIVANSMLLPTTELQNNVHLGIVNTLPDADGITRKTPIFVTVNHKTYENFSLVLLQRAFGSDHRFMKQLTHIPTENGLLRINYQTSLDSFLHYSLADVLHKTVPAKNFLNKLVLIGATAPDLHDTQLTPISGGTPESGIEIHAETLETLLSGQYLMSEPYGMTIGTLVLLSLLLLFVFWYLGVIRATFSAIALAILFLVYVFISFDHGTIRNIVYPLLAIFIIVICHIFYNYFVENKQRRFLRKAFSYYVSEPVLAELLQRPEKLKLGGEKKIISVLFSDIAGFTTISESLDPERLTTLLNGYLTKMTDIVFANEGVLDKYIGDAVMAFWGAPIENENHALLACRAALLMQEEIQRIQLLWHAKGVPNLEVRIGINTGEMVVGNMGSNTRFDYTLLGDNVNLGSRLEGINKQYGTKIIISKATYAKVNNAVVARMLDTVAVKGKQQGVAIYELISLGKPSAKQKLFLESFEKARGLYEKGQFKQAKSAFEKVAKLYPNDEATKVYLVRLEELLKHPPKSWDGIFHAKSK